MRSNPTQRTADIATVLGTTALVVMFLADIALADLTTGLVANWTFDTCTAADSSGNNLSGAIFGEPSCVPGVTGNAFRFDGIDDYFEVSDSPLLQTIRANYAVTVASWVNIRGWAHDNFGGWFNLIDKYEGSGDFGWILFAHRATASLVLQTNGGGAGCPFLAPLNEWLHLAMTFDGTDAFFYVNGELVCQASASPNLNATGPLYVGFSPSGGDDFLNGLLDELRLYNRALASSEIRELFTGCEGGVCVGRIIPARGGDTGSVTTTIIGHGFTSGMSVRLMRTGEPDITGVVSTLNADGTALTATFELTGHARGEWDVVVDSGGSFATLANGFAIEKGRPAAPWVDVLGPSIVRVGQQARYWVMVGNSGNVDGPFAYALLQFPSTMSYGTSASDAAPVVLPPQPHGEMWRIGFAVPSLPPGAVQTLPLDLRVTTVEQVSVMAGIIAADIPNTPIVTSSSDRATALVAERAWWSLQDGNNTPPFYYVFYKHWPCATCAPSVAVSLGNGKVVHLVQEGALGPGTPGGLVIHELERPGQFAPAWIVQPPEWSPEKANDRLTRFRNDCVGYDTGHCTSYRYKGETGVPEYVSDPDLWNTRQFPKGMCQDAPFWLWEESEKKLGVMLDNFWEAPGELFYRLDVYWRLRGQPPPEKWRDAGTLWWIADRLYDEGVSLAKLIAGVQSRDPNDKVGAVGSGPPFFFISGEEPLRYAVYFENVATATAPAQEVVVTDQLNSAVLDLSTFSFGPVAFGETLIELPSGSNVETTVDLRPGNNLLARVRASLDEVTGRVEWRFTSLDPATGLPTMDPLAGFLPPNVNPPEGDGSVVFTISPRAGLPTGTQITNLASIVFDANEPILTPVWLNTVNQPRCSAVPDTNCRHGAEGASRMQLRDSEDDSKDTFAWKWSKGDATSVLDFRDPVRSFNDYRVCVYDASARPQPLLESEILPGENCGEERCWKESGKGFKFKSQLGLPDGMTGLTFKGGIGGKAKLQVKGKGTNLGLPGVPLSGPVTVQFLVNDGRSRECWETVFTAPSKNEQGKFDAKGP